MKNSLYKGNYFFCQTSIKIYANERRVWNKICNITAMKPTIEIEYCPKCGWLLRAAYMAQELLTTFQEEVYGITLIPSQVAGRFQIRTGDQIIFDRKREDGFKDIKIVKQLVRDQICPDKSLGHSDRKD